MLTKKRRFIRLIPAPKRGGSFRGRLFICCLAFPTFLAESLLATTFYVDDDGGPGIDFTTIQAAANVVGPGDTVIVKDGIYTDTTPIDDGAPVVVQVKRGGTPGNWVTFRSENPWGAVVKGPNLDSDASELARHSFSWLINPNQGYVRIEGFDVTGAATGIMVNSSNTNVEVRGNHLHDLGLRAATSTSGQSGVSFGRTSSDILIEDNVFDTIGSYSVTGLDSDTNNDHGIYVRGSNVTIRNNLFYNLDSGWGVHVFQNNVWKENITITNNTFADPNPKPNRGQIILARKTRDVLIQNNIFADPSQAMINIGVSGSGFAEIENITVRNNMTDSDSILTLTGATTNTCGGSCSLADNTVSVGLPTFFADAANRDYHLQPTSIAIDRGISTNAPSTDFDGNSRPQNVGFDIGAFEFTGVPEDPFPDNLANALTRMADSGNFASNLPVQGLWDDTSGSGKSTGGGVDSFWVEYDLGELHDLSQVRLFGDALDNWVSKTYSVSIKSEENDGYTTVVANANAFGNQWFETDLDEQARFVKLEVIGDPGKGTQAIEFEVKGTEANAADFSGDGVVDGEDLALWQSGFGKTGNATKLNGDSDGDKDVDGNDFLIWQRQFGNGPGTSSVAATRVPEPSTLGLVGFLLLILLSRAGT